MLVSFNEQPQKLTSYQKLKLKQERILEEMKKLSPPLPADFDKWLHSNIFKDRSYLLAKRIKTNYYLAYCTHCKNNFHTDVFHHNQNYECPNCHTVAKFKNIKISPLIYDEKIVTLIQVVDDIQVIRTFITKQRNIKDFPYDVLTEYEEVSRRAYLNDKWGRIIRAAPPGTAFGSRFCFNSHYNEWRVPSDKTNINLYTNLYHTITLATKFKYSALDIFMQKAIHITDGMPQRYLNLHIKNDKLELLTKLNMIEFVSDYLYKTDPINFKNIDKQILKLIVQNNLSYHEAELAVAFNLNNINIIKFLNGCTISIIKEITTYVKIDKYYNYIKTYNSNNASIKYRDYLKMAAKLNYDMQDKKVLFPKSIDEAHDKVDRLIKIQKHENQNPKLKIIASKYKKLLYQTEDFIIAIPQLAIEIIDEGNKLHHCVGGANYIERMCDDKTLILFLRKSGTPQESFYTIELNPRKLEIIQCRTTNNGAMSVEVKEFTEHWLQSLRKVRRPTINNKGSEIYAD